MSQGQNQSKTYNWQYQPYIPWKKGNYNIASFVNSRPETNGSWNLTNSLYNTDGNAFLPRPIKHWRKQLQANSVRGGTKNVNIVDINSPGVYNFLHKDCCDTLDNRCYIVSNMKEKNNSTIYDNSETIVEYDENDLNCWNGQIGKRICCNPENNLISYKTFPIEKNYISYSDYFQKRCNDYSQNISTTKIKGNSYFNNNGIALYPSNNVKNGCQEFHKTDCSDTSCMYSSNTNSTKSKTMIYKPNNRQFAKQGAVSGKSRIHLLRENTLDQGGALYNNANGLKQLNNGICNINGDSIYYIKTK